MLESLTIELISQLPFLVVLGIGLVVACRRRDFRPRTRWSVLLAISIAAVSPFILPYLTMNLKGLFFGDLSNDDWQIYLYLLLHTIPSATIAAISWGLILFAVFDRPERPKFLREDVLEQDILDR